MTYHDQNNLRLEVEVATTDLPNLVQNPSGEKGAWGWVTPVANTFVSAGVNTGIAYLQFKTTVAQAAYFTSEFMPAIAGKYLSARYDFYGMTANTTPKARFEFYNASKVLLSSSAQSASGVLGSTNFLAAVVAPANTAYVKLRFDVYNGTGNPLANDWIQFNRVMVTQTATGTVQTTKTNIAGNPSVEVNTLDWGVEAGHTGARSTTFASVGTASYRAVSGGGNLQAMVGTTVSGGANVGTMSVTAGKQYTASVDIRPAAASPARQVNVLIRWFNSGGVQSTIGGSLSTENVGAWKRVSLTATAPSGATKAMIVPIVYGTAAAEVHHFDAAMFIEGTSAAYFDGSTAADANYSYAWSGTAHASPSIATSQPSQFAYTEPIAWRNILGPTHEIKISREGLDVGLLSAQVIDPLLDPSVEDDVRPGKRVRVQALDGTTWTSLFEGKITSASTTYVPQTRVVLNASDAIADLANQAESRTVATVAQLPYLMEGKGVPWSINGSGNQVLGGTIVGSNANASLLDQVAVTRDSVLAYAYVSKAGVLTVTDTPANVSMPGSFTDNSAHLTSLVGSFTDLDLSFNTDECINSVTVKWLRYSAAKGETTEVVYGPYRDEASIAAWGVHSAEFTIAGATESSASIATYAQSILTANAVPLVTPRSLRFAVLGAGDLSRAVTAELTYKTTVEHKSLTYTPRITGITHNITPDKWLVDLDFAAAASVASPNVVPSPAPPNSGSNAPRAGVVTINAAVAGTAYAATITFDPPFITAPSVVATMNSGAPATGSVSVALITTSSASIRLSKNSALGNTTVQWIAMAGD